MVGISSFCMFFRFLFSSAFCHCFSLFVGIMIFLYFLFRHAIFHRHTFVAFHFHWLGICAAAFTTRHAITTILPTLFAARYYLSPLFSIYAAHGWRYADIFAAFSRRLPLMPFSSFFACFADIREKRWDYQMMIFSPARQARAIFCAHTRDGARYI